MACRKLNTDAELLAYQAAFRAGYQQKSERTGGEVPLEYLRRSDVYGIFNSKGVMVTGYIIGGEEPFRLLDFVPAEDRATLAAPFGLKWSEGCEITCVWKLPEISSLYMCVFLWTRVLWTILFSEKKFLLGHDQNARLDQFYTKAGPITLYRGISSYGLHSRLFSYNRWRIALALLMLVTVETPRRFIRHLFK
jgi:hypothetical protein